MRSKYKEESRSTIGDVTTIFYSYDETAEEDNANTASCAVKSVLYCSCFVVIIQILIGALVGIVVLFCLFMNTNGFLLALNILYIILMTYTNVITILYFRPAQNDDLIDERTISES